MEGERGVDQREIIRAELGKKLEGLVDRLKEFATPEVVSATVKWAEDSTREFNAIVGTEDSRAQFEQFTAWLNKYYTDELPPIYQNLEELQEFYEDLSLFIDDYEKVDPHPADSKDVGHHFRNHSVSLSYDLSGAMHSLRNAEKTQAITEDRFKSVLPHIQRWQIGSVEEPLKLLQTAYRVQLTLKNLSQKWEKISKSGIESEDYLPYFAETRRLGLEPSFALTPYQREREAIDEQEDLSDEERRQRIEEVQHLKTDVEQAFTPAESIGLMD